MPDQPGNDAGAGAAPSVTVLLRRATEALAEQPELAPQAGADARTLLAHVLDRTPAALALAGPVTTANDQERFWALVERRASGVPVQHLTGRAWFRTVELAVGPGVFIPRPETEVMTGRAIELVNQLVDAAAEQGSVRVVELCAGSGAISKAIAVETGADGRGAGATSAGRAGRRPVEVHGVELSEAAHAYAAQNLAGTGVDLVLGDMQDAFTELDGTVDIVVANPPYVPLDSWEQVPAQVRDHDPELALFSGRDGLDAMSVVARTAIRLLRPGGVVLAEHAEVQHESVVALFTRSGGFTSVRDHQDLTGRWRFVEAVRR